MFNRFGRLAMIAIAAFLAFPHLVLGADRYADMMIHADQNYNYGRGLSDSPSGSNQAWGEAYILNDYFAMYESTRATEWLDKSAEHIDRIIAASADVDGDGFVGWPEGKTAHLQLKNGTFEVVGAASGSTERIVNGSFEVDANADLIPDGWTSQGNASKTYRSTASGDSYVLVQPGQLWKVTGPMSTVSCKILSTRLAKRM